MDDEAPDAVIGYVVPAAAFFAVLFLESVTSAGAGRAQRAERHGVSA